MLLSGVLFVLFLAGFAIAWTLARGNRRASSRAYRRSRRRPQRRPTVDGTHLMIIDRRDGNVLWYLHSSTTPEGTADAALSRHPAGRNRHGRTIPIGPDDDPEFLRQLSQRIHGTPTDPAE